MSYIPKDIRNRIHLQAKNRCGYCQSQQRLIPIPFEVEHIHPTGKGGTDDESNLWLSCRLCNAFKGMQTDWTDLVTGDLVTLFNPRDQVWLDHFQWDASGTQINGKTAVGRATIQALQLNHQLHLEPRRLWVSVGWHPPHDE